MWEDWRCVGGLEVCGRGGGVCDMDMRSLSVSLYPYLTPVVKSQGTGMQ